MFPDLGSLGTLADTLTTGVRDLDSRLEAISNKLDLLTVVTALAITRDPDEIESVLTDANLYILHHRPKMAADAAILAHPRDMAHPVGEGSGSDV